MVRGKLSALPELDARGLTIGIAVSRFNQTITADMCKLCCDQLILLGASEQNLKVLEVPGALEIPMALAALGRAAPLKPVFNVMIGLGCVIRGETYHFELVSQQSAQGLMMLQLNIGIPIINAILTVENEQQALARLHEKAHDAACSAVEMALLARNISYS